MPVKCLFAALDQSLNRMLVIKSRSSNSKSQITIPQEHAFKLVKMSTQPIENKEAYAVIGASHTQAESLLKMERKERHKKLVEDPDLT